MKRPVCHILLFLLFSLSCYGQKYCFFDYQVENGLAQSQAYGFCQDSSHRLWIATYGGVSRFDGAGFTNFTRGDGLINDLTSCLLRDRKNNIWIGTHEGLSKFDGSRFRNFPFTGQPSSYIAALAEDNTGLVWAVVGYRLFCIRDSMVTQVQIVLDPAALAASKPDPEAVPLVTTLNADKNGKIWIAVYKQGIFCRESGKWVKKVDLSRTPDPVECRKIYFDTTAPGTCWIVHRKGLIFYDGVPAPDPAFTGKKLFPAQLPPGEFYTMETDAFAKIWVLTSKGVFRLQDQGYERFSSDNGFTDNAVTNMYKDQENNLWFSTIGAGIWRYSFDPFTILDKPPGGKLAAVTAFAEDGNNNIWMGTYGRGLMKYNGHTLSQVKIPTGNTESQKILCLLRDDKGALWIGTDNKGGLWRYSRDRFSRDRYSRNQYSRDRFERIDTKIKGLAPAVNHISKDDQGGLWLSTSSGCRYLSKDGVAAPIDLMAVCTLPIGGDSVLVGTEQGLYLLRQKNDSPRTLLKEKPEKEGRQEKSILPGKTFRTEKVLEDALASYTILSLLKKGDSVYIGTQSKGLVIWNYKTGSFAILNNKTGLNSDIVYGLLPDRMGNIWVTTGKGINRIAIDPVTQKFNVFNYATPGTITASETDQNAVLEDRNGKLWFGTTKGALLYDPHQREIAGIPAGIVLQQVRSFTREIEKGTRLPYDENHLTFEFRGISFKNAHDQLYQYKLEGLETKYSALTTHPSVVYSALPPGQYTFLVRSFIPGVGYSPNTESFPFEISGPFYKNRFFQFFALLGLILFALGLQSWNVKRRQDRKVKVEMIRQDEQDKIRQRTSEDFHDELGNKITRISVLSELLFNKLDDREEARRIIRQIKENIGSLYTGTREILWSLTPMSNHLHEIVRHLREFGIELFQDTPVLFHFSADLSAPGPVKPRPVNPRPVNSQPINSRPVRINSEYSRNIMMICKEAMTNVLKHARAGNVFLEISLLPDGVLTICLRDDGKGFDPSSVTLGHGIVNMRMRSERIHGLLHLTGNPNGGIGEPQVNGTSQNTGQGTRLMLTLKIPFYEEGY